MTSDNAPEEHVEDHLDDRDETTQDGEPVALRFGGSVASERARRDWSVEDAAEKARMTAKTWRRIERGQPLRAKTLNQVDSLFGLIPGTAWEYYQNDRSLTPILLGTSRGPDSQSAVPRVAVDEPRKRSMDWSTRRDHVSKAIASHEVRFDLTHTQAAFDFLVLLVNELDTDKLETISEFISVAEKIRKLEQETGAESGTVLYIPASIGLQLREGHSFMTFAAIRNSTAIANLMGKMASVILEEPGRADGEH